MSQSPGASSLHQAIGQRIAERRRRLGLTQGELGDLIGYSQQHVGAFEAGRRRVPTNSLPAISRALGVRPEALLLEADATAARPESPPRVRLADAVRRLEALPLRHRRVVLRLLEAALDDLEGLETSSLPVRSRPPRVPRGPRPPGQRRVRRKGGKKAQGPEGLPRAEGAVAREVVPEAGEG